MITSAAVGGILGILRSKILTTKYSTTLHYSFLGFSIFLVITAIIITLFFWQTIIESIYSFNVFIVLLGLISGITLFIVTKRHLIIKDTFRTNELDPIVNSFTSNADKNEIKLFGGDLNFFGNTPSQMESNSQYTHLRSMQFKRVFILCEEPKNSIQKTRYGKILSDMPSAELRFYHPDKADLRVRGRIIKIDGVNKLLIYTKVTSGIYKAIETDTANSTGARYINIWDLVWSLAVAPSDKDIFEYKSLV